MAPVESSWPGLKSVLYNVLHLSVVGFPFVNPGPIGGGDTLPEQAMDPELYIRWWQLCTFLPMLQFGIPPSAVSSEKVRTVRMTI